MAKTKSRPDEPLDMEDELDDVEETESEEASEVVVSDSRARRKRKRGEAVVTSDVAGTTEKKNRPTPKGRETRNKSAARASRVERVLRRIPLLGGFLGGVAEYLRGVSAEMQKVTWPSREETLRLTRMVIIFTTVFSLGLGGIDLFYGWWFQKATIEDEISTFLGIGAIVSLIAATLVWFIFYRRPNKTMPY